MESAPEDVLPSPRAAGRLSRITGQTSFSVNVVANYLGRGWEAAMSVAFVPLYIRYLGTEAYGVIGIVAVIQSFMLILDFGMTPTLTREAARYQAAEHDGGFIKDLIRSVEWVVLGVSVLIVGALALAAPLIAERWVKAGALGSATIADALTIGGVLIALRFFESVFRGTLYGLQRQLLCNLIAAVFATLRGAGAVLVIVWFGGGLRSFFVWQAVASLAAVLAMRAGVALALPKEGKARFSKAALMSIGRFALGMVAISLLSLAATQADKVALSRMLPLHTFGYYVFAANVALVLELVAAPIMTAVYPRVIEFVTRGDEAGLADFFHRWARIIAVLTAPAAAWLVFFAPQVVLVWSGDPVLASRAGALLSIIAIGTFLHGQCVLPYYVQLAEGWTGLGIWSNALALLFTIPSLLLLVPHYGAVAGAWTWVAVASLYFFGALQVMFGRFLRGERWRFFFGDVGTPAIVAFSTTALCAWLLRLDGVSWWLRILSLGAVLAAAYAVTAIAAWTVQSRVTGRSGTASIASSTSR